MTTAPGLRIWLGGVSGFKMKKGFSYKTKNGTIGELRTIRRGERLRLTYQPKGAKHPSTLQMTVIARKSTPRTCVGFHQEKLASAKERERMRAHWQSVLDQLQRYMKP